MVEELSLRDYFAAAALQGLTAKTGYSSVELAKLAYRMAEAMMAERNKKVPTVDSDFKTTV
jgi:hypothetical protein